jgi:hypothetical protein
MKKFFLSIFYFFWNFRKRLKFKGFESKLSGALVDKYKEQIVLIKEIKKEIDLLWPHGHSKYIPLSFPQRVELRAKIYSKFGERMNTLNVKVNANLEFK